MIIDDEVKKTNDTDKEAVIVRLIGTAVQATIYPEDMFEGYKDTGNFEKCVKCDWICHRCRHEICFSINVSFERL